MDRGVQAHNQLRLNLDVPYDVRRLEARLRPPPPVVIERLGGSYAQQPSVSADSGGIDPSLAADPAASALAALSRDRLAAAQMLARRDLKQQRFVLDAQQRLAGRTAGTAAASRPTTPSSAPRRAPSVARLLSPAGAGGLRLPAATRIVSSMALAAGRRTPDRPGSGTSGRNSGAKSAPGGRTAKGDSAAKRRLSSAKAATSAKTTTDDSAYGYDSAAAGTKETAAGTAPAATADDAAASALTAEESHTGASQLLALQEHIRTIEGELKHLSNLAGKSNREDDAVQRLSESHRGAIRALQSLAAEMPNRKRSDGDATYRELSSVMKQLSQLCTQLELAGAESTRLSQDPRDTAKADIVASGGVGRASPAFASPGNAAAALGLKSSRKASASGKRSKGLPIKLPSERLYPRTGSHRSAATKKSASAGMATATTVRRSPYAPKQSPVIVSPYLTKPLPVSLGSINNGSRENRATSDASQPDPRRGAAAAAYFNVGQTQVGGSSSAQPTRAAADADDKLRIEDGLLKPANFIERLVEARRRYTDSTAIARGSSGHDGSDADVIDPVWLEELTRAAYLEQHQRQQQQSKLPTLEEEAVISKATSRTTLTNPASAKASSLRLSAAPSAVFNRQIQDEVAASRMEQQQQLQQGDGAVVGSGKEELKDYRGGSSSRKPSAESLNNGLARMLEAKVSSNGDLLADMILSDLVEDTAREMAELEEQEDGINGDQPGAASCEQLYDELLGRIATIQTEQNEIRRRWTEMHLHMRNTSPTVLDADEMAATVPPFTATGTAPQPYVAGNVELSTSSSAATSADAAHCRDQDGDEGRALTFTRRSRTTAPRERSSQADKCLDSDNAIAEADGIDRHGSHCNHSKVHRARREASAVRLSVPDSMLLSIADNLDEYKRYLARTYQETTSEFDPARFAEECAERIQDDCIEELAGEVGKAASDIVDKLYKDEFLPLSRGENEASN